MLFFPYKVDLNLNRFPIITLFVCLICITVYYFQVRSEIAIKDVALTFCTNSSQGSFGLILQKVVGSNSIEACTNLINVIHSTGRPDKMILKLAEQAELVHSLGKSDSIEFLIESLGDLYANFKQIAPPSLTAQLMYDPRTFRVDRMVSASFSHGSWSHLVGNLFFFFAFAATVEILIGSFSFLLVTLFLAVATNMAYSLAMFNDALALPTLGLSGVVMGMIGLFTFLIPTAKIRCFLWFIILVRVLSIPAWILAGWYIGWDIYSLYTDNGQSTVNFVAHVSGAVFGVLAGLFLFRKSRLSDKEAKSLQR